MLNEKQFRDRALRELREIARQVQSLTTDRKLFQDLQSEIIARHPLLADSTNPYLLMIRAAYTDATIMRLRRLFAPDANLSLRRLIAQISDYPDMLHDKLTGKELAGDLAEMEQIAETLKTRMDPHFSAHERTSAALASANKGLDRGIDVLADCVKRYYWIVSDSYVDVDPAAGDEVFSIFGFAWLEAR